MRASMRALVRPALSVRSLTLPMAHLAMCVASQDRLDPMGAMCSRVTVTV